MASTAKSESRPFASSDEFADSVALAANRVVLVYRRRHQGRDYIRLRVWNRHLQLGLWYPSRRFFVAPRGCSGEIAEAIHAAVDGQTGEMPPWLSRHEQMESEELRTLGAKEDMTGEKIEELKRTLSKSRRSQH